MAINRHARIPGGETHLDAHAHRPRAARHRRGRRARRHRGRPRRRRSRHGGPAPAAVAGTAASTVLPYPQGRTDLAGAGTTGFLTWSWDKQRTVWTRYADGATKEPWPGSTDLITASRASDVVARVQPDGFITLRDMTTDEDVLSVSARIAGPDGQYIGAVGRTALVRASNAQGGQDVRLIARGADGLPAGRLVTKLPGDAKDPVLRAATADTALLTYTAATGTHWATVDLATAAVTRSATIAGGTQQQPAVALTGKHVAWLERGTSAGSTVVVTERTPAPGTQRISVPGATTSIGLVGSWLTYAQAGGYEERNPSPAYAVTARYLGNGTTRKLMDDMGGSSVAPDGSLYVQGGTVAGGEGLYRIAPARTASPPPPRSPPPASPPRSRCSRTTSRRSWTWTRPLPSGWSGSSAGTRWR
ncbi:hypothetical protein O1L60_22315 [Streptomyces diastatochromogenes]|nr:hypothetical protein [Streptomyces diastatochromogenes]